MRQADEDRFREFVRNNVVLLRHCGFVLCGDWHLAEDLVQTALYKLYRAWPRVQAADRPVAYARTTLTRCWLDEHRRPWRKAERRDGQLPERADPATDPASLAVEASVRERLFAALDTLSPRQRAVLMLRYFVGLSVAETAREMRCAESTVRSQASRGLASVRAAYGVSSDGDPSQFDQFAESGF